MWLTLRIRSMTSSWLLCCTWKNVRLRPRRPVGVAWPGEVPLAAGQRALILACASSLIAPGRLPLDPVHDRPDLIDPFEAAVPGVPDQRRGDRLGGRPWRSRPSPPGVEPVKGLGDDDSVDEGVGQWQCLGHPGHHRHPGQLFVQPARMPSTGSTAMRSAPDTCQQASRACRYQRPDQRSGGPGPGLGSQSARRSRLADKTALPVRRRRLPRRIPVPRSHALRPSGRSVLARTRSLRRSATRCRSFRRSMVTRGRPALGCRGIHTAIRLGLRLLRFLEFRRHRADVG